RFGRWRTKMTESDWLAEKFQEKRPHLRAVACRILGSNGEADDAVQEAWFRLTRSDVNSVENLGGWLTTGVARVWLGMLRAAKARKKETLEEQHLVVSVLCCALADFAGKRRSWCTSVHTVFPALFGRAIIRRHPPTSGPAGKPAPSQSPGGSPAG